MQITDAEIEIYRQAARAREQERRAVLAARRERAWQAARRAALLLKEEFGASRVVVFGSLLDPARFHLGSDIDLAAWDVQDYFRAVSHLLDLDPEFEFDLVAVEDVGPGLKKLIDGVALNLHSFYSGVERIFEDIKWYALQAQPTTVVATFSRQITVIHE